MKHINKKLSIRGAGLFSKPKPKPAILHPPKLGGFKSLSSYNVAEIIDLISDGPIEGLVNQRGEPLNDGDIFKGIYLDNTPIQNTESPTANSIEYGSYNISSTVRLFTNLYILDNKLQTKKTIGSQSAASFWAKKPKETYGSSFFDFFLPSANPNRKWSLMMPLQTYGNFDNGRNYYHSFSNGKIELHPVKDSYDKSYILSEFEKDVKNSLITSSTSASKIARDNLEELKRIRAIMKDSRSVSHTKRIAGAVYYCPIIIDLGKFKINSIQNELETKELDFVIEGLSNEYDYVHTLAQPEISNGLYTGNFRVIVIIRAPLIEKTIPYVALTQQYYYYYYFSQNLLLDLHNTNIAFKIKEKVSDINFRVDSKYNFSNVSCQFKIGTEDQTSLDYFNKVYNDYAYDGKLLGPFVKNEPVQRILVESYDKKFQYGAKDLKLTVSNQLLLNMAEGSRDSRSASGDKDYSSWNDINELRDYNSLSITHTVENSLVDSVSVSIQVNSLSDSMHISIGGVAGIPGGKLDAGAKLPSIVAFVIEIGKIKNGIYSDTKRYTYSIVGLVESPTIIDFGAEYAEADDLLKDSIKLIEGNNLSNSNLTKPFILPSLTSTEDPTTTKRYVRVYKLSAETNSVLINKEISLGKVTEIISQRLSYPFSALAGIKLDARSFNAIPERSYDCKLKKVKVPINYEIKDTGTSDVRYVSNASDYTIQKQIYKGDWNGLFREAWTDNPAWILYDLLTSERYGLGSYIDETQINKWELYKIAKFCDAVDDDGYYIGVSDGVGGLEPRFSCNIIFKQETTKVYDAINVIANLFRGIVFFGGSEVHFLDDRPRTPIALFNNANAKDGTFTYSNTRRDLQFNTVEVAYLDRFDNYKTKIEYIQNEEDIRKRGVFKTTINTMGVTSRAMARRIGQHIIYQTTKENQTVDFATGLEALLCRPGDLIIVEDEMKTRSVNYGKILEVDNVNKRIRIDNQFDPDKMTGFITAYTPTGYSTSLELDSIALLNRSRVEQFTINKALGGFSTLTGVYRFSGYTSGFANSTIYPSEFPLYTGLHDNGHPIFCYYSTGSTGFIFATGKPYQDNTVFDKIVTNTGVFYGVDFSPLSTTVTDSGDYTGFIWTNTTADRRNRSAGPNAPREISGQIQWDSVNYPLSAGVQDSEIDTYNISQITKISFTGYNNNVDYGSILHLNTGTPSVAGDPNVKFLSAIKPGTIYKIERKNASDQIYKILSIRENSQNEYSITASKYDTGKFETIEKAITQDYLPNTFYTGPITVNNTQINQLAAPKIVQFEAIDQTAFNFKITGKWEAVSNATNYSVTLSNDLANYSQSLTVDAGISGVLFNELTDIGNWQLSVTALGSSSTINSLPTQTGLFVAYSSFALTNLNKPVIESFTIQ